VKLFLHKSATLTPSLWEMVTVDKRFLSAPYDWVLDELSSRQTWTYHFVVQNREQPTDRKHVFHISLQCRRTDQILCKSWRTSGMPQFKGINSERLRVPPAYISAMCVQLRRHTDSITSGRRWYRHLYSQHPGGYNRQQSW